MRPSPPQPAANLSASWNCSRAPAVTSFTGTSRRRSWAGSRSSRAGAVPVRLELLAGYGVITEILRRSRSHDLVILRSQRRMVEGIPIPASDRATGLLRRLRCSTLVISDPLHAPVSG